MQMENEKTVSRNDYQGSVSVQWDGHQFTARKMIKT